MAVARGFSAAGSAASLLPERRRFLATVGLGMAATAVRPASLCAAGANDRLRIAVIGCGGRGFANLSQVAKSPDGEGTDITVLCDVFEPSLLKAGELHPKARRVRMAAREAKVATKMGIQIHAGDNYRRVVELVRSGAIGPVSEVHVWVGRAWGRHASPEEAKRHGDIVTSMERPPQVRDDSIPAWGSGCLVVGTKGMLLADYGKHVLLPEKQFEGFVRPDRSIPSSPGQHQEWLAACRGEGQATCGFEYSGLLTEANHLGNVAYRVGRKIPWDSSAMACPGVPETSAFLARTPRTGWSLT